jgi:hypothetical protein
LLRQRNFGQGGNPCSCFVNGISARPKIHGASPEVFFLLRHGWWKIHYFLLHWLQLNHFSSDTSLLHSSNEIPISCNLSSNSCFAVKNPICHLSRLAETPFLRSSTEFQSNRKIFFFLTHGRFLFFLRQRSFGLAENS